MAVEHFICQYCDHCMATLSGFYFGGAEKREYLCIITMRSCTPKDEEKIWIRECSKFFQRKNS